jgi:hypothetical protein
MSRWLDYYREPARRWWDKPPWFYAALVFCMLCCAPIVSHVVLYKGETLPAPFMMSNELHFLSFELDCHAVDHGRYPGPTMADVVKAIGGPSTNLGNGLDPWGRPLLYRVSADGQRAMLYSCGPNGIDEGGGRRHLHIFEQFAAANRNSPGRPVAVNGSFWVTATYTATSTQNLSPEVTITDSLGAAYVADPALVANIDTSGGAADGQPFTLPLSLGGIDSQSSAGLDSSQIPAYWYITWGDGADGYYPISDTSETHTYALGTTSETITAEVTDASQQNVLAIAYADPLVFAPAAPINLASYWTYSAGNTPSLTLCWTNDSSLATGFEIDELSGDGQTYTTLDTLAACSAGNSMSDTLSVPNPDPQATYYVFATMDDGTTYSDAATIQAGIIQPTLAKTAVTYNSVTLAYSDPSAAEMTLYYEIPGVDNMHAYTELSPGDGTVTVYGLSLDQTYSFQIDAYTADQDVKSAVVNDLGATPPVITDVEPVTNGGAFQGEFAITFTTTDPNLLVGGEFAGEAQLAAWTSGDTDHLYAGDWTGSGSLLGGQIPIAYSSAQPGGVYTITAMYYIPTDDPTVDLQIVAPNAPPSAVYTLTTTDADTINSGQPTPVEITGLNSDLTQDGMTDIVYDASYPGSQGAPNYSNEIVDFYDVANGQATFIGEQSDYPLGTGLPNPINRTWYVGPLVVSNSLIPPGSQVFAVSIAYVDANGSVWMHSDYSSPFTAAGTASGGGEVLPAAPSDLTATLIDENDALLHWTDNSDNEDTFEIDVLNPADANGPNDHNSWIPVATGIPADSTTYTVTQDEIVAALGPGATLYDQTFHVEGVDQVGPPSTQASTEPTTQPGGEYTLRNANGVDFGFVRLAAFKEETINKGDTGDLIELGVFPNPGVPPAQVPSNLDWVQVIDTNDPLAGKPNPSIDVASKNSDPPFYFAVGWENSETSALADYSGLYHDPPISAFNDTPQRQIAELAAKAAALGKQVEWTAHTYLVSANYNAHTMNILAAFSWGFTVRSSGAPGSFTIAIKGFQPDTKPIDPKFIAVIEGAKTNDGHNYKVSQ